MLIVGTVVTSKKSLIQTCPEQDSTLRKSAPVGPGNLVEVVKPAKKEYKLGFREQTFFSVFQ